jgi:hypothetical protein
LVVISALIRDILNTRSGKFSSKSWQKRLSEVHQEANLAKIKVGRLYRMPNKNAVRVIRVDWMKNLVIVRNYHSHSNEAIEYESAPSLLVPLLRIGEVAKIVGKKTSTIRKYENDGLLPQVEKISLNPDAKTSTRVYSPKDIEVVADFFDRRKPAGRPGNTNVAGINKSTVKQKIDSMYIRGNING